MILMDKITKYEMTILIVFDTTTVTPNEQVKWQK